MQEKWKMMMSLLVHSIESLFLYVGRDTIPLGVYRYEKGHMPRRPLHALIWSEEFSRLLAASL